MSAPAATRSDIGFYRDSAPFFAALLLLALPAFWPSYIRPKEYEADFHVHLHGIALFLWAAMLIAQPWLIRAKRLQWHRRVGKLSYVLAPVVVASTFMLMHYRAAHEHAPDLPYFFYLQFGLIVLFAVAYVQAIRYRRAPGLHARYMACTALAMFDPIVARLLYNVLGIDIPYTQLATYGCIDAILLYLWMRDRRAGNGITIFPAMLAAFAAFEVPTFFLPQTAAWEAFVAGFARLPLP